MNWDCIRAGERPGKLYIYHCEVRNEEDSVKLLKPCCVVETVGDVVGNGPVGVK